MKIYCTLMALVIFTPVASSQTKDGFNLANDPKTPAASTFRDGRTGVTFQIPSGWDLNRKDGNVSTFRLDARSAIRATQMRAIASIAFNPFPLSTFSGAYFYFSQTPRSSEADCARQASFAKTSRATSAAQIGGVAFTHGYDEHGLVCTEARDNVYTAFHRGACYRFDLVINTFCGGDAGGGARDITDRELESVNKRLESILSTVRIDK